MDFLCKYFQPTLSLRDGLYSVLELDISIQKKFRAQFGKITQAAFGNQSLVPICRQTGTQLAFLVRELVSSFQMSTKLDAEACCPEAGGDRLPHDRQQAEGHVHWL